MDAKNNQAALASINHKQLTKSIQTLLGICTGITADNHISDQEVYFLKTWLSEYPEVTREWPGRLIAERVDHILHDGVITNNERIDLLETLQRITSTQFTETGSASPDSPLLPIDDDPSIFFRNMTYCFTGRFIYGTRANCERAVLSLGAMPVDRISKRLNYLVIGTLIEPTWLHTNYGLKIQSAIKHKESGADIGIISEKQWAEALKESEK